MQDFTNTCMIWLILAFGLVGIYPQKAPAQQRNLLFKHINSSDGLAHNAVYSVFQDRRGFMWFGTQEGLNRYDGHEIKTYRHELDNPGSIDHNWITYINEDREGTMWVCTSGGGINRYNFETDSFDQLLDPEDPDLAQINVVRNFAEDQEGFLWLSTDAGLFRINKENGQFKRYVYESELPGSLSGTITRHVFIDSRGTVWISTSFGGLNRYDADSDSFIHYQHDPADAQSLSNNAVSSVFEDYKGDIWVGTVKGLNRYNSEIDGFEKFLSKSDAVGTVSNSNISAIWEDARKDLWIGTYGGGLNLFNKNSGSFENYTHHPARSESISNNKVRSMWEDHAGTLWVGTENGVNYVDLEAGYFSHIKHDPTVFNSLSDNAIYAIFADPVNPDVLWVGTETGGLNRLDVNSGRAEYYQHDQNNPSSLSHNFVEAILVDHMGTVWAGTRHGLNRLDQKAGTFSHLLKESEGLFLDRVRIIYEAPSEPGVLWIAAGGGGLVRYEVESGNLQRFPHDPSDEYSISAGWVSSIYEDERQQLWVGASGGGLNRFDRPTQSFRRFQHDQSRPQSLASKNVDGIVETTDGMLWLATDNGLVQFDVEENGFQHFTDRNSNIPSNTVKGIVVDDQQKIWISTNAGISSFDPQTHVFENFDIELGLQGRAFNARVYHQDEAGNIYFGGLNGLNVFNPDDIKGNPHPPRALLTDISIFNERLAPGENSPLGAHVSVADEIQLDHAQNEITIDFIGFHYSNPSKNQYQVKLESYDNDWRAVNLDRRITYTNLNPGNYTFKVKAANANGVWSEEINGPMITIKAPWWLRPWAFLMYAIMFGSVVFSVDRFQRAKLLRKEREAAQIREAELRAEAAELKSQASESQARALKAENDQKEVELEKASELKEAYDALQNSMDQLRFAQKQLVQAEKMASLGQLTAGIAHEIKNPLNFVINFAVVSQSLMQDMESLLAQEANTLDEETVEDMKEMLSMLGLNIERINEHGLRADSIVKSMMDHSRPSDGALNDVSLTRVLNQAIDLAYAGLTSEAGNLNIEIVRDFDEAVGDVKLNAQDFTRVIINILENAFYAVKESASTRNGQYLPKVCVSTALKKGHVRIEISDNGPGISDDVKAKIFDPFYTTKPTGAGNTGLGLSLSYDIIAQGHNGKISIDSEEGKGAVFIVEIPV
ncbi:MAG: two-component regulator propeller domain-containing protein [Rhodothermales bacterium]